ncbi:MAG TPA: ZIP family metal transporter, partial [Candidatus Portnoybacteria bacterium]|nr:ZIP family metal transporter [Candidatus Portnoybacteria bacterium]
MDILFYILGSTFLISLLAFIGALTLFFKEKLLDKILLILVAFSAGALIGGAFLHLIPEAIAKVGPEENSLLKIFLYLLLGFCLFFVLEQFIRWHHHHATRHP